MAQASAAVKNPSSAATHFMPVLRCRAGGSAPVGVVVQPHLESGLRLAQAGVADADGRSAPLPSGTATCYAYQRVHHVPKANDEEDEEKDGCPVPDNAGLPKVVFNSARYPVFLVLGQRSVGDSALENAAHLFLLNGVGAENQRNHRPVLLGRRRPWEVVGAGPPVVSFSSRVPDSIQEQCQGDERDARPYGGEVDRPRQRTPERATLRAAIGQSQGSQAGDSSRGRDLWGTGKRNKQREASCVPRIEQGGSEDD